MSGQPAQVSSQGGQIASTSSQVGPGGQSGQEGPKAVLLFPEKGIRRKFLIWVHRYVKTNKKVINVTTGDRAHNKSQLSWPGQKSDYLRHIPSSVNQPNRVRFRINISSLAYLGAYELLFQSSASVQLEQDLQTYFRTVAEKQLGRHLVVQRNGGINALNTMAKQNTATKQYEYTTGVIGSQPLTSVYPVLREQEDSSGNHLLTLGMAFINDGNYQQVGSHRHYFRCCQHTYEGVNPNAAGNTMFELTESRLEQLIANNPPLVKPRFALYVCAGAKLFVFDDYRSQLCKNDPEENHHNRSLVQQGGVVVCEGELELRVPTYVFEKRTLTEMIDLKVLSGQTAKAVKNIKYPVIFLGANESDHNSIAWDLSVSSKTRPNQLPVRVLQIPEGGYIVAIEDWDDGLDEIWCRHKYERLFESNIDVPVPPTGQPSYSQCPFEKPEFHMIRKILGAGQEEREFESDVSVLVGPYKGPEEMSPLKPKEFNFNELHASSTDVYPMKPPMPALMPPIRVQTDKKGKKGKNGKKVKNNLYYLPNRELVCDGRTLRFYGLEWYENHYDSVGFKFMDDIVFVSHYYEDREYWDVFELSDDWHNYHEHEWVKCDDYSVQNQNKLNRRYGVDGWVYEKKQQFARYRTKFYEYSRKIPVQLDQQTRRMVEVKPAQAPTGSGAQKRSPSPSAATKKRKHTDSQSGLSDISSGSDLGGAGSDEQHSDIQSDLSDISSGSDLGGTGSESSSGRKNRSPRSKTRSPRRKTRSSRSKTRSTSRKRSKSKSSSSSGRSTSSRSRSTSSRSRSTSSRSRSTSSRSRSTRSRSRSKGRKRSKSKSSSSSGSRKYKRQPK